VGAAARKIAHTAAPARPLLRLVSVGHRRTAARSAAAASTAFRLVAVCLVMMAVAGAARVALAADAAEASIDAWELRTAVKAERLVTRTLEADRSSLAAPSRIEAVACQTLNMSRPTQVSYLQLPGPVDTADVVPAQGAQRSGVLADAGGSGLVTTLMDLAAGEAQVMLVGDVGLGSLE